MHGPTGQADKIGIRISEVVSRYRPREDKRAKCRSFYLSPLRPLRAERRVVREYFSAVPSVDPRTASMFKRERERANRVLHSSRAILRRRIRTNDTPPRANTAGTHAAAYSRAAGARI